jgi:tetratricopeptide (TPR) repeat protein
LVLLLVAYPAARWMLSRGAEAPRTQADSTAFQSALESSFQHYQARRYDEAVTAAKGAIAMNPNSAEAYNNLAVSYLGLRKFDEATQAAQTAIRLQPNSQLAKNNLVWIQQERAKASAPAVAPAAATQAAALVNQSLEHSKARRFRECIDTATQAVKLNPGSAIAFNNIGFCSANLQLWDDAIRNTAEAVRLDPTLQIAKNNLAWMLQERGKAGPGKPK